MKKTVIFKERKTTTKILSLLFIVLITLILGSCSTTMTQSHLFSTDSVPSEDGGYIYGLFENTSTEEGYAIGIVVQNLDTFQKYNFILQETLGNTLQVTAVPSGNYRVDSIEYIKPKNKVDVLLDFDMPPEQYQRTFVVELNTAVYIGDYVGTVTKSTEINEVYWSLKVPVNNYDKTTSALQEKYPLLTEPPITFVSNMKEPQVFDN